LYPCNEELPCDDEALIMELLAHSVLYSSAIGEIVKFRTDTDENNPKAN
jgi:hypothetical protein